jgi:hypothetical protein
MHKAINRVTHTTCLHAFAIPMPSALRERVQAWTDRVGSVEDETPRFQDNRHMNVVRLSPLRTGRLYAPGNIPGTHFSQRLSRRVNTY